MSNVLLDVKNVSKSFKKSDKQDLLVLDNVALTMHEGEIIALLGKSGSGKSTLLRIIAGLVPPSSGEAVYQHQAIKAPVPGISMVFQSFALMPWLTVLENVELGLEAQGVPRKIRRERAIAAIDMIGLDGFESAYPKELSGGMKQRVGLARALVVEPDLLLMDEPFSALDVLTAETLRNDLMELWQSDDNKMKGILFVTHNIEEAVEVADRILVFGSNPGHIRGEIKVDLPHPRDHESKGFEDIIDEIYTLMTTTRKGKKSIGQVDQMPMEAMGLDFRLPAVNVAEMTGLLETLNEMREKGSLDLPDLADEVRLDIDDLFPLLEGLSILGLAKISEGDIAITDKGREMINADITDKKVLFASLVTKHIPLAKHIQKQLHVTTGHRISEDVFMKELSQYFTEQEAEKVLETVIDWGRYAEIFAYDYNTGLLSLEDVA